MTGTIAAAANDCVCAPGYYSPTAPGGTCLSCPNNAFCPLNSSQPINCTANASTQMANQGAMASCQCNAGFFGQAGVGAVCRVCTPGSYCLLGNSDNPSGTCPTYANSPALATSQAMCSCIAGYYGKVTATKLVATKLDFGNN